jgi:hypothetical protein
MAQLIAQHTESSSAYLEFLKVYNLSMGLYVFPAGGTDSNRVRIS